MIENTPPAIGLVLMVTSVTAGVLAVDQAQQGFRRLRRVLARRSQR
jgi:hypothetical protein